MKRIITSLILISPLFAFAQNSSDIKVQAKIVAGCLMSANDVHFNFDGSQTSMTSVYHPHKPIIFNNYQDLNIQVQCSKGTNIYLYSSSPQYPHFKLKHNVVENAPTPIYWFTFKSVTEGAKKITSNYVRIHNESVKLNFRLDTPVLHTLTFATEVEYKSIQNFIPGDYSDTITLVFNY